MKIVLFIPTASVIKNKPSEWLQRRLDTAIDYYNKHEKDNLFIVVAGRWNSVDESYLLNEAEVSKRYILSKLPNSIIIKEDIAVETGGGFAFAKPLINSIKPDKVVIFNSKVNEKRNRYLAKKIFSKHWKKELIFINDTFSKNPRAIRKEPKALEMFKRLFENIKDGDDQSAREILLYKTPFYFKGVIADKGFFDKYWPGGYEDFPEKRLSVNNK